MDKYSTAQKEAIDAIADGARELRRRERRPDLTPYYLKLLDEHSDEMVRSYIWHSLRQAYLLQGNIDAATEIVMKEIAERPLDSGPLLDLATQKHYNEEDAAGALPLAINAVALADDAREYRRHARATLLRIASALGDTALVKQCLVEIMDLEFAPGEPDIGREADLLVHGQAVGVDRPTLLRYRAFLGPVETPITGKLPPWSSREDDV